MKKIIFSLITLFFFISLMPEIIIAQRKTPKKKPKPIKKESVFMPQGDYILVPVKKNYAWNSVFTGQVSSIYAGLIGNEIFAATDSSLYRSENHGKDWTLVFSPPLNLAMPNTFYGQEPNYKWNLRFQQSKTNPQIMYLALIGRTGNITASFYASSLWKSIDGGKNWQFQNDDYNYSTSGVLTTQPYQRERGGVVSSMAISPKNPNTIFKIAIGNFLFKSLDGGINWTNVTPDAISPTWISINPHDAENMYLLNGQRNPLETTDGGSTWHELKYNITLYDTGKFGYGTDEGRRWSWITFHPDIPKRMFGIINERHLVASDDGGKTWKDISYVTETYRYRPGLLSEQRQGYKIASVEALDFSRTTPDTLYISTDSGIVKTTDFGRNYNQLLQESAFDFLVSKDDKKILAITKLGMFQASEDFGKWTNVGANLPPVVTSDLSAIDSFDSSLYLLKSNGDIIKSIDGFKWEWEKSKFNQITYRKGYNPANFKVIQYLKTSDGTSYTVAAYEVNRKIIKELPDGNKQEIKTPIFEYDWCNCRIALSYSDSQKIYIYSNKKMFISNDGGASWEESINNGVAVAVVSPQNSNTTYAVLTGRQNALNSVLTTTDGGKTWRAGTTSLQDLAITTGINEPFRSVTVDPRNSNVAYVTTRSAVFRTTDSGQNWSLISQNLFSGEIYDLIFDYNSSETVYLATSNGVWQSKNSGKNWIQFSDNIPIYGIISNQNFTITFSKDTIYRLAK